LVQQTAAAAKNNNKPNYDADEEDPGTSDKPSRFTERRAAPFYAWAGIHPKHLYKTLPSFFINLIEASSQERSGLITGFIRQLQVEHPATLPDGLPLRTSSPTHPRCA
jgi:hypothetical protein